MSKDFDEGLKVGMAYAAQRFLLGVKNISDFDKLLNKSVDCMFKDFKSAQEQAKNFTGDAD